MIRPERSMELYSRGAELVNATYKLWEVNEKIQYSEYRNIQIEANILALCEEFDLTIPEWHYWANRAAQILEKTKAGRFIW